MRPLENSTSLKGTLTSIRGILLNLEAAIEFSSRIGPGLRKFRGDCSKPVWGRFHCCRVPLAQYPSRLLTMFFKGSPFSNLPYCLRKNRIA